MDVENNIILPIKPCFASLILSGKKKYEYRKRLCKNEISKIYIYATSPIKCIVGEVIVLEKVIMHKDCLWTISKAQSGITDKYYYNYFGSNDYACAYHLGDVIEYNTPICLKDIRINYAPQSFIYCKKLTAH